MQDWGNIIIVVIQPMSQVVLGTSVRSMPLEHIISPSVSQHLTDVAVIQLTHTTYPGVSLPTVSSLHDDDSCHLFNVAVLHFLSFPLIIISQPLFDGNTAMCLIVKMTLPLWMNIFTTRLLSRLLDPAQRRNLC